jgi:ubiquinone/menaquinone biosynthesis C-methylase UbiE
MNVKDSVQRQFGAVAAHYATSSVHRSGPDLEAMLAAANLTGSEQVLDLGSGTGHTALAFAPHVQSVIGIDLTSAMLDQARQLAADRQLSNVTFQTGDVEALPFPDQSFDIVTSRYSAHHYPHPELAMREAARVLKPGGTLLLVDVVAPADPTQDTFLQAIELLRDPSHVRDHNVAQWQTMLSSVGLPSQHLGTWPLQLHFRSWIERMNTPPESEERIRFLLDGAPSDVRSAFQVQSDYSFSVPVALISAAWPI